MRRALLALAGLVALLALVDAGLGRREARARRAGLRVGTVFGAAEAAELRGQPAFTLAIGGAEHAFGRVDGAWRCFSRFDAPADGRAIEAWLEELVRAEGIQCASSVEEAPRYGINVPETIRVTLQGPRARSDRAGDVRAALEIGKSLAGGEGCFVRRLGSKAIWSLATDLRAPLERPVAPGLPPLLAPGAVPEAWLAAGGGSVRVALERDGTRLELRRRERAEDGAPPPSGALPWFWELLEPAGPTPLPDGPANAFVAFLERLPYVEVLDRGRAGEVGLVPPAAVVELESRAGTRLRLEFGAEGPARRVALRVAPEGTLYRVDPAVHALALPTRDRLTAAEDGGDPWSAFRGGPR
jgi:hypothetical protein